MERISRYYEYISMFPKLFLQNDSLKIITDRKEIEEYALANHTDMGILFENNTFAVVVDLVENELGTRYASCRIINKNGYNGVVVIPVYEDKIMRLSNSGMERGKNWNCQGFSKGISPKITQRKIYEELGGSKQH